MNSPYIGVIAMIGANFAPRGWALCQGQLLSIQQNAALFSILGTTYGGNGTTTFALPDLRAKAAVQQGPGGPLPAVTLGQTGGTRSVSLVSNNLPQHTHPTSVTLNAAADGRSGLDDPTGAVLDNGTSIFAPSPDGTTKMNAGAASVVFAPVGGNVPVNTQNTFLGVNYIIATQGLFPSRN